MLVSELRPVQAMAAAIFFRKKRLLLQLPRQYGGKTELGVRIGRDLVKRPFPSSGLFIAKDRKSGKKMTSEKMKRLFDEKKFIVNTERVENRKCSSSVLWMDSCDKDPDRMRGGTYSYIHWAEVAFAKVEHGVTIMDVFNKILAPTLTQTKGYALLESTNNGYNGWKDIWDSYNEFGFERLRVSMADMVALGLVSEEEYLEQKSMQHPLVWLQEYECEWVTFQGAAYPELDDNNLMADMVPPEPWQVVVIGVDWGFSPSATCLLFAYVKDGIIYVFDEIYKLHQRLDETSTDYDQRLAEWKIQHGVVAADHDPARIEEINREGIPALNAQKSNVMGVRMQIKKLLHFNRIKIDPIRCPNLVRDLRAAIWHPKKDGELDDDRCTWGHWDAEAALRYLVRECSNIEASAPIIIPNITIDQVSAAAWLERRKHMEGDYDY